MATRIYKPNVFVSQGMAGHGKDLSSTAVMKYYNENLIQHETIRFSRKAKEIIETSFKDTILGNFGDSIDKSNPVDYLKDDVNVEVIAGVNMRGILQSFLGDFIRSVSSDMHILWECEMVLESYQKIGPDVSFLCGDNRYKNELSFLYNLNLQTSHVEKILFAQNYIASKSKSISNKAEKDIKALFRKTTGSLSHKGEDGLFLDELEKNFLLSLENIRELSDKNKNIEEFKLITPNLSSLSAEEAFSAGFINVFRPIVNPNILESFNIEDDILTYSSIGDAELSSIIKTYNSSGIEFRLDNIQKYGYLRANPLHQSESELDDVKSERVMNTPFVDGESQLLLKIENMINDNHIGFSNDFDVLDAKKSKRLVISAPVNLMLESDDLESLYSKYGVETYLKILSSITDDGFVLPHGKLAKLQQLTNYINHLIEKESLMDIELGIVTRNAPFDGLLITNSLFHHKLMPAFLSFTNGEKRSTFNKHLNADLVITSSKTSKKDHEDKGFNVRNYEDIRENLDDVYENPTIGKVVDFYKNLCENDPKILSRLRDIENYFIEKKSIDMNLNPCIMVQDDLKSKQSEDYGVKYLNNRIKNKNRIVKVFDGTALFTDNGEPKIAVSILFNDIKLSNILGDKYDFHLNVEYGNDDNLSEIKKNLRAVDIHASSVDFHLKDDMKEYIFAKDIDLHITENKEYALEMNVMGVPSLCVSNTLLNKEKINEMSNRYVHIFDLDEVVIKNEEALFKLFNLKFFNAYQKNFLNVDQDGGPLFNYFIKIGGIVEEFDNNKDFKDKMDFELIILTSRGGDYPRIRFMNFINKYGISSTQAHFLSGMSKTGIVLHNAMKGGVVQFMDDHPTHLKRIEDEYDVSNGNIALCHCISGINNMPENKNDQIHKIYKKIKRNQ